MRSFKPLLLPLIALLIGGYAESCLAVDVEVDNQTASRIRVKLIAKDSNANAYVDVQANSRKTKSINPPNGEDQVWIAWKGNRLIDATTVDWTTLRNARKLLVVVDDDSVLVDVAQGN